jgi:hypothetical protein
VTGGNHFEGGGSTKRFAASTKQAKAHTCRCLRAVVPSPRVVTKGGRQFAGDGHSKPTGEMASASARIKGRWKVNVTQRIVKVPFNDGKWQAVFGISVNLC